MSEQMSPRWEKITFSVTLIVSLVVLLVLFFIVPYQCEQVSIRSGGEYVCDIELGWYTFTITFILLAIYSGYKLYLQHSGKTPVTWW
jgi:uncharacterized membrane protein (DUF485 family)